MVDTYSTTINVNGDTIYSSKYTLGGCCCRNMYTMNSCFGFGYPSISCGIGFGVGMMAGMALLPAMPAIFRGIGKGLSWLGTNFFAPVGRKIAEGAVWAGKKIGKGASWVAQKTGIKKLWNKIFNKKSKAEAEPSKQEKQKLSVENRESSESLG